MFSVRGRGEGMESSSPRAVGPATAHGVPVAQGPACATAARVVPLAAASCDGTRDAGALACGTSAAEGGLPARGPDYFRDAADLARLLGSAHAIRVRCNGRDDQYWRRYMADMLAYEAPEPGSLRASLVRAFNEAYSDVSDEFRICNSTAIAAEARYATSGQEIATRLATHYFPKRERSGGGFD